MADEEQQPVAEQPTEQPVEQAPPEQEQEVDWSVVERALDKVPADQLRKHKRFAGILGGSIQQAQRQWEIDNRTRQEQAARERSHQELRDLAQNDPLGFAEKWLGQDEADRMRSTIESMKADTAQQYMHQIGAAFGREFNLTEDEISQISEALAGKSTDEVLPTFNVTAARIVTQREAQKMFNEWRDKELPKERDALKQELAAEMMKGETPPSIRRSTPPSTLKPHQLNDKDFDDWYETNVLKRARSWSG